MTATTKAKATVTRSRCSPMYVRTRTGCGWLLTTGTRADRYECRCSGLRPNQQHRHSNARVGLHCAVAVPARERDNDTRIMLAPLLERWKRQRRQRRRPPSHATGGGGESHRCRRRCRSSSHTHTHTHSCACSHSSPPKQKETRKQQLEVLELERLAANQSEAFAGLLFFIAFPPALH